MLPILHWSLSTVTFTLSTGFLCLDSADSVISNTRGGYFWHVYKRTFAFNIERIGEAMLAQRAQHPNQISGQVPNPIVLS